MRATSVGAILSAAVDEVKSVAGYQHVWFLVADREELDQLRLIDYAGTRRENVWETAPLFNVKGDKFLEDLVASDEPVVIEDARTDSRTDKRIVEQLQNRTLINIPLRPLDTPLGIFGIGTFGDEGCRAPSPRELDHFVAIAGQVAVALARIRLARSCSSARSSRSPATAFNYLALPVTTRNGRFRFPKLNIVGSNPISRYVTRESGARPDGATCPERIHVHDERDQQNHAA